MPDSGITKKALAAAMKELMNDEPFSKISIGEICDKCDMHRKSFYYHFRDKYELVNRIFKVEFSAKLLNNGIFDCSSLLDALCEYLFENRRFYANALRVEGQDSFSEYFKAFLRPIIEKQARNSTESTEQATFCTAFCLDAMCLSMRRWLSEGACASAEEYAELLRATLFIGGKQVFNKESPLECNSLCENEELYAE